MTSQITTSGRSRSIIVIASAPVAAARTWSPRTSSAFSTTFRTLRLSSTTRTFRIGGLLRDWRPGRVGAALVDSRSGAQQELFEVPVDRPHAVDGRRLERIEDEAAARLTVRRHQQGGEGGLADEPEELRVYDPSPVEEDGAAPRRQRDEELAGLHAERDGLRDVRQLHHRERSAQAVRAVRQGPGRRRC